MKIKIDTTEITVPEFIASELVKKKNRKLFDNFLRTVLAAQGQRIRNILQVEYSKNKNQWEMIEKLLKSYPV